MRHKMDMEPDEIQIALKRAGVTQADIARRLGVHPASVSRVISGHSVSDRIRLAIADSVHRDVKSIWPSTYIFFGGPRRPGRPSSDRRAA